jgi:hypothetical protein
MAWCQNVAAHGGVGMEDDRCVISIGFLKAHFIGYQPKTNGAKEFCEDIPEVANSVFVIDYLHGFLREMLVDFRIIRDVNDFGIFANWEDIAGLESIEQDTVFYEPPMKHSNDVLKVNYNFQQAGGYIGVVTAVHPEKNKTYHAVFYFEVGGGVYTYLPLYIALIMVILALSLYWFSYRTHK